MYNPIPDLIVLGLLLLGLAVLIKLTSKPERGATPCGDDELIRHQNERRIRMMDGDYK